MRLVCVSDTHGLYSEVVGGEVQDLQLPAGNVLIHCGDFSAWEGKSRDCLRLKEWLQTVPSFTKTIIVPGNHDRLCEVAPALASTLIGIQIITHGRFMLGNTKCFGTSYQPQFGAWSFNRPPEQRTAIFEEIPQDTELLVTHCPPFGHLDRVHGESQGDKILAERIAQLPALKYVIFGHIHEGYGQETVNGITYINCSLLNERYELKNKPTVIDI